jgi:hypothetical protein
MIKRALFFLKKLSTSGGWGWVQRTLTPSRSFFVFLSVKSFSSNFFFHHTQKKDRETNDWGWVQRTLAPNPRMATHSFVSFSAPLFSDPFVRPAAKKYVQASFETKVNLSGSPFFSVPKFIYTLLF